MSGLLRKYLFRVRFTDMSGLLRKYLLMHCIRENIKRTREGLAVRTTPWPCHLFLKSFFFKTKVSLCNLNASNQVHDSSPQVVYYPRHYHHHHI